jgi:NAD(P)-dependent dehydrogenase (short-subunit alcohol dehydrogenase family)
MAVNARSTMLCYKHAAKQMIAQGRGGRIIGDKINDMAHIIGAGGSMAAAYCASKFAVRGLTQAAGIPFLELSVSVDLTRGP